MEDAKRTQTRQRNQVIVDCHPMVVRLANKVAATYGLPVGVEREDLVSCGVIGLAEAWERYEPDRGIAFEAYALPRIRGAIIDAIRASDWVPRKARLKARQTGDSVAALVSLDADQQDGRDAANRVADDHEVGPGLALEDAEDRRALIAALNHLPDRERYIIVEHYFQGTRLDEVAATFEVTPSRVSQLHSRALKMLKTELAQVASAA